MKLARFRIARTGTPVVFPVGWRSWIPVAIPVAALASMAMMAWSGSGRFSADILGNTVPSSAELLGFSGHAGEWELAATMTRMGQTRDLSGPVKMTHVGWCSQDGPETKSGEVVVTMARLFATIDMRLRVDGVECRFQSRLTDIYTGDLICPDKRPVPLSLWLR